MQTKERKNIGSRAFLTSLRQKYLTLSWISEDIRGSVRHQRNFWDRSRKTPTCDVWRLNVYYSVPLFLWRVAKWRTVNSSQKPRLFHLHLWKYYFIHNTRFMDIGEDEKLTVLRCLKVHVFTPQSDIIHAELRLLCQTVHQSFRTALFPLWISPQDTWTSQPLLQTSAYVWFNSDVIIYTDLINALLRHVVDISILD